MHRYIVAGIVCIILLIAVYTNFIPVRLAFVIYILNVIYFLHSPVKYTITGSGDTNSIAIYNGGLGRGIQNDGIVVAEQFSSPTRILQYGKVTGKYDIFIHQQNIAVGANAKYHIWIPNLELITDWDIEMLPAMDLIVCKTRATEKKLKKMCDLLKASAEILYTGFTTNIHKPPSSCVGCITMGNIDIRKKHIGDKINVVHLGGSSQYKNTDLIIDAWCANGFIDDERLEFTVTIDFRNVHLKKMTSRIERILSRYGVTLTDDPVRYKNMTIYTKHNNIEKLFESADIALCLSAAEGFGHYINEALYYGIIPLVINAPPMNEFVSDIPELLVDIQETDRKVSDLVDKTHISKDYEETAYIFDNVDFAGKLDNLISKFVNKDEFIAKTIKTIHDKYVKNKKAFVRAFKQVVALSAVNMDQKNYVQTRV